MKVRAGMDGRGLKWTVMANDSWVKVDVKADEKANVQKVRKLETGRSKNNGRKIQSSKCDNYH